MAVPEGGSHGPGTLVGVGSGGFRGGNIFRAANSSLNATRCGRCCHRVRYLVPLKIIDHLKVRIWPRSYLDLRQDKFMKGLSLHVRWLLAMHLSRRQWHP